MVHAARALGLGCMLGCMIESGIGIAAGAHVSSLFDHVDLDGNLLMAHDPFPGVEFLDGVQLPAEPAGPRRRTGVSERRYLLLAEGFSQDPHYGKTARGVLRYRRDDVVAILDSTRAPGERRGRRAGRRERRRRAPLRADDGARRRRDAGRPLPARVDRDPARAASRKGLDIENGLHVFLADDPELPALAERHEVELRDLRRPPADLSTATGANLAVPGTIVLTVGSDCAIGKMTVSLSSSTAKPARAVCARSSCRRARPASRSRAGASRSTRSSQTSSRARRSGSCVEGSERGGELLWVEGQGAILHPVYSGVTLGLYHGSVPHLLVLCHEAGTTEIEGAGGGPHPSRRSAMLVDLHERLALPARPARVAAVAAEHARDSPRTRRGRRSPPPRPRPACPRTIRCASARRASSTRCSRAA